MAEVRNKTQSLNILGDRDFIDIIIDTWEIKEGGFLSKNYIMYDVFTTNLQTKVKRRISDFEWLRKFLVRNYPATYVKKRLVIKIRYHH